LLRGSSLNVYELDIYHDNILLQNPDILGQIKKIQVYIVSLGRCQVSTDNWFSFMSHALIYIYMSVFFKFIIRLAISQSISWLIDRTKHLNMKMHLKLNVFAMIKNDYAVKTLIIPFLIYMYTYVSYKTQKNCSSVSHIIVQGYYWSEVLAAA